MPIHAFAPGTSGNTYYCEPIRAFALGLSLNIKFCEYISSAKLFVLSQIHSAPGASKIGCLRLAAALLFFLSP